MNRSEIKSRLLQLMREFFAKPDLEVSEETTAADVPGWDSLAHINFMLAIEKGFGITLTTREVRGMKNVGALMHVLERKTA